jgi:hypothetical protein
LRQLRVEALLRAAARPSLSPENPDHEVQHDGFYLAVGSMGGDPKDPLMWHAVSRQMPEPLCLSRLALIV